MSPTPASTRTNWTPRSRRRTEAGQYNAAQSVEFYIRTQGFKYSGEEELDGVKLHRYDGELTGDMLNGLWALRHGHDALQLRRQRRHGVRGSMPMSIWLDAETFAPVRYELDMSQVIAGYMQGMFEAEGARHGERLHPGEHQALRAQRHRKHRDAGGHRIKARAKKVPARAGGLFGIQEGERIRQDAERPGGPRTG